MAPRDEDPISGDEMLEEEEEQEEVRPRKKKKMKMGDDSGLTDEERRLLRRQQRELAKALQDGPVDDDDGDFVNNVREKNNVLFEKVAYTREAVLDAENVHSIAAKLSKKVDDMIQVRGECNGIICLFAFLCRLLVVCGKVSRPF